MRGSGMWAGICGLRLGRACEDADGDLWLGAWLRGRGNLQIWRTGDYRHFEFEGSEVTLCVVKTVSHPKYNSVKADNDIALLRLESPVTFGMYIVPACLPSQDLAERALHLNGTMTVVMGWGMDKEWTAPYSSDLKHINVALMEQSECAHHMVNNLTGNVLCAGSIGSVKDVCSGDSGGPMMTLYRNTWFLIGLVSWGEGCGHTDKLGIYTKVSNYLEWIDSVTGCSLEGIFCEKKKNGLVFGQICYLI
ncbi:hypothetical protein QTP86_000504 [Hemibagrus guttatus]|nr:hypothetical protein QTP86_000504 [Hemibagrus guttatus]